MSSKDSKQDIQSATDSQAESIAYSVVGEDEEVLDDEPKSILLGLISQLRKGMDLHKVTLPTFVLEPRSMLERITDFMAHADLLLDVHEKEDPLERFIDVVRYYMSGWHIKPKGVKKPYNPVIGEYYRCRWKLPDGSDSIYVAEQTSHHPPISAYYYSNPKHKTIVTGNFRPKSKFLGNSAATMMHGSSTIIFLDRPGEEYVVTNPNVYARGILFGTMTMELGDIITIRCEKTGYTCELEFKVKGFFTGSYNAISGKIKHDDEKDAVRYLSGHWSDTMYISKTKKEKDREVFFECADAKLLNKIVANETEQEEFESRRLWSKVTKAMLSRNLDLATDEKTRIEDEQRKAAKLRDEESIEWTPRFFHLNEQSDQYLFSQHQHIVDRPDDMESHLEDVIFPKDPMQQHGDMKQLASSIKEQTPKTSEEDIQGEA